MEAASWRKIRTWEGSQHNAFEELVCQLAHCEAVPMGSRFTRKGRPDSGLECFWQLPDGQEWGWQTKFVDTAGKTQWEELDGSVRKALDGHPQLTRFLACLPLDLPDGRQPGRRSARDQWNLRCQKWKTWASDQHRSVEFILWDSHELLERLSQPKHSGRLYFWFNQPCMDADWFAGRLRAAVEQAGPRYERQLHQELVLSERFDALAWTPAFTAKLEGLSNRLTIALFHLDRAHFHQTLNPQIEDLRSALVHLRSNIDFANHNCGQNADFSSIELAIRTADIALGVSFRCLRDLQGKWKAAKVPTSSYRDHDELSREGLSSAPLRETQSALEDLAAFSKSSDPQLAKSKTVLLKGEAGLGKTHLFCSVAEAHQQRGEPTILLLGERFGDTDPWTRMIQLLGLTCTHAEFLGALNSIGEAVGCRSLVLIDAINEGPGVTFWNSHLSSILADVQNYPNIAIGFSLRQTYVSQLKASQSIALPQVEHHGFAGQTSEATRAFFRHFGLAEPTVPLLAPEFDNPLLLKLICIALRDRGAHEMPANLLGVSAIFGFVLENINARLADTLDYDPAENRVAKAAHRLGSLMASYGNDYLPLNIAREELSKIHPSIGHKSSLLWHLTAENILVRVPVPDDSEGDGECIRFTYQRLSDHLIVEALLERTPKSGLRALFGSDGLIGERIAVDGGGYGIAGWLESFAVQLPENYGLELHEIAPNFTDSEVLNDAFVESLVWRRSNSFTPLSHRLVSEALRERSEAGDEVRDAVVAVATRENHPLNADWLDSRLRTLSMPHRDAFWSIYLYGQSKPETSIGRLIEWASNERSEDRFSDETARLAGLTLTWCLTTADRFTRDRATKALVSLLTERIGVMRWLLKHFVGVNEPYLQERLHAAAYGCALRTLQGEELGLMAEEVYARIFREGSPPPSVLLRDHARGIVDAALARGLSSDIDRHRLKPPFTSDWPTTPPKLDNLLRTFSAQSYDKTDEGTKLIFESVTDGDFKRYIITDVFKWSRHRHGVKQAPLPNEVFEKMLAPLPSEIQQALKVYGDYCHDVYRHVKNEGADQKRIREAKRWIKKVEKVLPEIFGKRRARQFLTKVKPYLQNPYAPQFQRHFDMDLFQRMILRRIVELGYTNELFAGFDHSLENYGRESHKAERIGKKYQWMAYDELHARISDNFGPAEFDHFGMTPERWERGTWTEEFRDLDPSLLLRRTFQDSSGLDRGSWWTPAPYDGWNAAGSKAAWLRSEKDLPEVRSFLTCNDTQSQAWLVLDNFLLWKRSKTAVELPDPVPGREELHYIFRSYLVRREHLPAVMAWGRQQDWINDRLPSAPSYEAYLAEHYQRHAFHDGLDDEWFTTVGYNESLPCPIVGTTAEYRCEDRSYDCSVDADVRLLLTSRWIAEKMGLRQHGRHGDFVGTAGQLVAWDPSTREHGHPTLLIDRAKFQRFLAAEGLALIWTLLGEKNVYSENSTSKFNGRMTILGIYSWTGQDISGGFRTTFQAVPM